MYFKDWTTDTDTTTPADLEPATLPHGPGGALLHSTHWDDRLLFAGAAASRKHPGYLEGALLSTERAVAALMP